MNKFFYITTILITSLFLCQNLNAQTQQRNPVLEFCMGTWCQWCPCGDNVIKNDILPNIPNAILLAYHGAGTDPFRNFPGNNIIGLLGLSAYPTGTIDRVTGIQNWNSGWTSNMSIRNGVPATVSIGIDQNYNEATREFTAIIDFTALQNLDGQFKYNIILVENGQVWGQTSNNTCTPGITYIPDYVHYWVVRDMMNGAAGEEIVNGIWNQGQIITKTVSHTFAVPPAPTPDFVPDSCGVVVLVYKSGAPLNSNAEIQQAENFPLNNISEPFITVFSPNGGENWQIGSDQTISWTSNEVSNVKIEYTTDGGNSWTLITDSTTSDGNYNWTIPNTPSNFCKIKITDINNEDVNDESNNVFNIAEASITVNSPNGGEVWLAGTTENITWNSSIITNVKIEFSTNSGVTWIVIISSTPSTGVYSWTIPNTPSSNCRVKVSDANNNSIFDVSNNDFSIVQPFVTVNTPNGGEGWQIGSNQNITWTSSSVTDVKIEYTTDNGSSWIIVTNSTPSNGIYSWTIPNTPSTQCKIKISDASNQNINDESNNVFSIVEFVFYALIQADSIWIDTDYDGLGLGMVDGSGSYISQGTITNYEWYLNNDIIANGVSPTIELTTGTNIIKLIVTSNTGSTASDSMYISLFASKLETGGAILSGVSQFGNTFYVSSMNNGVYRIDSTGTILQSYLTGGSIRSSLCISNQTNLMYVGSTDTRLYCFDAGLNSLWDRGLGGVVDNSASVNYNGEVVYIAANDNNTNLGFLKALEASTGNPKWTFQADGTVLSSPIVMELVDSNSIVIRTIIYFGSSKGTLYAIDDLGLSYDLFWSEKVNPDSAFESSPAISNEGMIYIGSKNGYLYRFNWDGNYETTWKKYTGGPIISSPIIDENEIVYIASGSGYIYGFNKYFTFNSDPLKSFYQSTGINGTAGISPDGTLLVGCDNGKFFALDKNTSDVEMTMRWYFQASNPIYAPTLVTSNGMVYIGTTNGDIYVMKDPYAGERKMTQLNYEWPTFKGDNQRSKVVRLIDNTTSVGNENKIVTSYKLYQNYPNPFNPATKIRFEIASKSFVTLRIFDVLGNEVKVIVSKELDRGSYEMEFEATQYPSGIYFYRLQAGSYTETKKMILLK